MSLRQAQERIEITRAILAGEVDTLVARRAAQLGWRAPEPAPEGSRRPKLA